MLKKTLQLEQLLKFTLDGREESTWLLSTNWLSVAEDAGRSEQEGVSAPSAPSLKSVGIFTYYVVGLPCCAANLDDGRSISKSFAVFILLNKGNCRRLPPKTGWVEHLLFL